RAEQLPLVCEVVVEGAPGNAGLPDDLLGPDGGVAPFREKPGCDTHQLGPRGLRLRGLPAAVAGWARRSRIHAASMLSQVLGYRLLVCKETDMKSREQTSWRSPALGTPAVLDVPGGRLRCFEAGEGPPAVFVDGLLVNANLWRKVVSRLAPAFHCVAL